MKLQFELDENILKDTLETWSRDYMTCVHMEEFSEVVQAISKIERAKREGCKESEINCLISGLEEELADVIICISNMIMGGLVDVEYIQSWIEMKQERQEKRNATRKSRTL